MPARRIQRYIISEISIPAVLGLGILTFILLMGRLPRFVEMVVNKGVPFFDMVKLIGYMLPTFLIITLPMAFLLGILLGFGRLSADCEVVALKSLGIGLYGLVKPVFLLALAVGIVMAVLTLSVEPASKSAFQNQIFTIATSKASVGIQPGVFNADFDGLVMFARGMNERSGKMTGVFISDERDRNARSTITAQRGWVVSNPQALLLTLHLENGAIHREPISGNKKTYQVAKFNTYDINLNYGQEINAKKRRGRNRGELSTTVLREERDKTLPGPSRNLLTVELLQRIILPFTPFLFTLVGVPLGIQSNRSGRSGGFVLALLIFLAYYLLLSLVKTVGREGPLPPTLAMWLPNLIFLVGGLYFFHQAAMERRIFLLEWFSSVARQLRQLFDRSNLTH